MIVAVPGNSVSELESRGLAFPVSVFRGATLDAIVTVGTDAATLVTLLQAPDAIRAFADWIRGRCQRRGDSIELSIQSGGKRLYLKVDSHIDVAAIADFIALALQDENRQD